MHYLDNAATTQVHPAVSEAICAAMEGLWANASSLYPPALAVDAALLRARRSLAAALGVAYPAGRGRPPVLFTGSGSEANNLAVLGIAREAGRRRWASHIVATGYEHPSVEQCLALLQGEGYRVQRIAPGADGRVDPGAMLEAVGPDTGLVCAMRVNNETGAALDVAALARAVKAKNRRTAIHCDAVQAFCKLPLGLEEGNIDSAAVSGHKLHAPKGVGALYLRPSLPVATVLAGGGQEGGLRPGTENAPYIVGFAKAAELALAAREETAAHTAALQARLLAGLAALEGVALNSPEGGYAGVVNFSLPGLRSQPLLNYLAEREIYVSSGSACSGGKPSHTLQAMGLAPQRVDSALRVSFSGESREADVDALLARLAEAQKGGLVRSR